MSCFARCGAEPRPVDPPARGWRDWALVSVLLLLVPLEGLLRPELPSRTVSVIVVLAVVPTLLWRRTRPLLMVAIAFTATGVAPLLIGHEPELVAMAFLLILPYALFRWGSGREAVAGAAFILAKGCLSAALGYVSVADAAVGFVVMFATFALATAFRYRARLRARELDQAKLLERERLARVDVEVRGDLGDLPPTVGTAIYRLAQESVTNARRHARHATRIEVPVAADSTSVRLRVSDDGDTSSPRPNGSGGLGLAGMGERAGLLGGTCEAGPNPDRGWTVTAALPRTGTAA